MKATLNNGIVLEGTPAEIAEAIGLYAHPGTMLVPAGSIKFAEPNSATTSAPFVWTTGETDHG